MVYKLTSIDIVGLVAIIKCSLQCWTGQVHCCSNLSNKLDKHQKQARKSLGSLSTAIAFEKNLRSSLQQQAKSPKLRSDQHVCPPSTSPLPCRGGRCRGGRCRGERCRGGRCRGGDRGANITWCSSVWREAPRRRMAGSSGPPPGWPPTWHWAYADKLKEAI